MLNLSAVRRQDIADCQSLVWSSSGQAKGDSVSLFGEGQSGLLFLFLDLKGEERLIGIGA